MAGPTRVVLGRVVGAHGLRGELRVRCFSDDPGNLIALRALALGAGPDDGAARRVEVERAAPGRRGEVRMRLAGVTRREAAEALRGLLVLADADQLPVLPAGEHYAYQWIGCRVEGPDGAPLGSVRELWNTGAHEVLVIEDEEGRQILFPAVAELLREVDVEEGRIVVETVPGLLDPT